MARLQDRRTLHVTKTPQQLQTDEAQTGDILPEIVLDEPLQGGVCVYCLKVTQIHDVIWQFTDDTANQFGKLIPMCRTCYDDPDNWVPLDAENTKD
jgi:hypothetical protein